MPTALPDTLGPLINRASDVAESFDSLKVPTVISCLVWVTVTLSVDTVRITILWAAVSKVVPFPVIVVLSRVPVLVEQAAPTLVVVAKRAPSLLPDVRSTLLSGVK